MNSTLNIRFNIKRSRLWEIPGHPPQQSSRCEWVEGSGRGSRHPRLARIVWSDGWAVGVWGYAELSDDDLKLALMEQTH